MRVEAIAPSRKRVRVNGGWCDCPGENGADACDFRFLAILAVAVFFVLDPGESLVDLGELSALVLVDR